MSDTPGMHPIFEEVRAIGAWFEGRHAMDRLFQRDGYVYATDARIIVRTRGRLPASPDDPEQPDAASLPWPDGDPGKPYPPPRLPREPVMIECDECQTHGHYNGDSDEVPCPFCSGAGMRHERYPIVITGNVPIRSDYAEMLLRHGATLYPPRRNKKGIHLFYFRGEGYDGLLTRCCIENADRDLVYAAEGESRS